MNAEPYTSAHAHGNDAVIVFSAVDDLARSTLLGPAQIKGMFAA
jgi:hypothetical protein